MFNVERPKLAPLSLIEKKSWTGSDVLHSLRDAFYNKCYICETKEPLSLNVEHFDAHMDDVDKMYDWNNLFLACARCNNFKRHLFNNLINCTDPKLDVLRLIRHAPPVTPFAKTLTIEPTNNEPSTIETASLIRKVFTDDNTGNKDITGTFLRKRVYKRYSQLLLHINTYIDEDSLESEKVDAILRIKNLMNKNQEYSAFLRWAIIDSPELFEVVKDSIN
ncbi:HNH endonuclease [Pseudomonas sp. TB1-B1]|uniref:HNH endonuclease n=1 Tax=Pseudomonas sp. TB1-B1 TaxID=2985515 RepID=UPI003B63DE5C